MARPLGENPQRVAVAQHLHGRAHRAQVGLPALDGEAVHVRDVPANDGVMEELFLGHEMQLAFLVKRAENERIDHRTMVREDDKRTALGHVLAPLHLHAVQSVKEKTKNDSRRAVNAHASTSRITLSIV